MVLRLCQTHLALLVMLVNDTAYRNRIELDMRNVFALGFVVIVVALMRIWPC